MPTRHPLQDNDKCPHPLEPRVRKLEIGQYMIFAGILGQYFHLTSSVPAAVELFSRGLLSLYGLR